MIANVFVIVRVSSLRVIGILHVGELLCTRSLTCDGTVAESLAIDEWFRVSDHRSQRLGNTSLHAFSGSFLVKRRHPLAVLLLPDRRGDNLPSLLLAAAGCILGRRIGHNGRVLIEPEIEKSDNGKSC